MSETHFHETATLRRHRAALSGLLIMEGTLCLLGTGFFWLIVLRLFGAGYGFNEMNGHALLFFSAATVLCGLLPLCAAYALLKRRAWAKTFVLLAVFGALALAAVTTSALLHTHLSRNRLIVLVAQNGLSIALTLYGFWFVSRRNTDPTRETIRP